MGVSRPTIYTYVRNKDELLAALVHDVLDPTVRLLEEVAAARRPRGGRAPGRGAALDGRAELS
jgi:AcrR family transcriptional regulator